MSNSAGNQPTNADHSTLQDSRADPQGRAVDRKPESRTHRRFDSAQEPGPPVQLPAFRELQKLMMAVDNENLDFAEFCAELRDVPLVRTLILRNAQSVLTGRANRIENLKHALAMLGLNKVRAILAQLAEPYEQEQQLEEKKKAEEVARVSA